MELRHLRYFTTLAEELHFRKASEKLFIAQPALSRQIKELEKELQVPLFERNRRKVSLTPAGKHLYQRSGSIFQQLRETKLELKRVHNMELGRLRIGYVATAMHSVLPLFLAKIKKRFPALQLSLHEMTTAEQIENINNGSLEFAFARAPINNESVTSKIVAREKYVLVVPANHPLTKKRIRSLGDLRKESFIFFPRHRNPGYYDQTISLCYQHGLTPNIQYEGVGSYTLLQMVASGLGITILPSSIAKVPDPRVQFIELKFIKDQSALTILYNEEKLPEAAKELITFMP